MKNFGKIKNTFYGIITEGIVYGDNTKKELFSRYINAINENKILKTQFLVYTNLEDKAEINEAKANEFAKANILYLRKFKKSEIEEANKTLIKLLGEQKSRLEKPYDEKLTKLHENITKIIFTNNNPLYVETMMESYGNIAGFIMENNARQPIKEDLIPSTAIAAVVIEKFNQKYSDLNEHEKLLIKYVTESNEKNRIKNHKEIIGECIELIDKKINENDGETKNKLIKVKEKLASTDYCANSYTDDITKLIVLKSDLNN